MNTPLNNITVSVSRGKTRSILLIVLLVSQFLPTYYVWAIAGVIIAARVIQDKGKLKKLHMPGQSFYWCYLIIGTLVGAYALATSRASSWHVARDLIRMTTIPLFFYLGDSISAHYSKTDIYKNLYAFFGIYSVIGLFLRILNYFSSGGSLYAFRTGGAINEYIVAIGLFMSFFKPDAFGKYYYSKTIDRLLFLVLLFAFLASFSRTAIVLFGCMIICSGLRRMKTTAKVIIAILFGGVVAVLLAPELFSEYLAKLLNSFFEISASHTYWTTELIVSNWRGYEVDCAMRQFAELPLVNKLLGLGFGSHINAYGYAYLVTREEQLAWLHNGYFTALIKSGIVGVLCVIGFLGSLFSYFWKKRNISSMSYDSRLCMGIVLGIIVAAYVIHGVFIIGVSFWQMLLLATICKSATRCTDAARN